MLPSLLLQSTADNRVRVRLNGQHFLPAVHNHEAEVHFGSPFGVMVAVPLQSVSTL
jgi:hypothetical protein